MFWLLKKMNPFQGQIAKTATKKKIGYIFFFEKFDPKSKSKFEIFISPKEGVFDSKISI